MTCRIGINGFGRIGREQGELADGERHVLAALFDAILALQGGDDHRHRFLLGVLEGEVLVGEDLERKCNSLDHGGRLARSFIELASEFLQ